MRPPATMSTPKPRPRDYGYTEGEASGKRRRKKGRSRDTLTSTRQAVKYLLEQRERIVEERVHALTFLGEVKAVTEHNARLTNATYVRDAYSVYSEEISQVLDEMNLSHRSVYRGGHRVPVYDTRNVSDSELEGTAAKVLGEVCELTEGLSTDDVVEMCRHVPEVRDARLDQRITLMPKPRMDSLRRLRDRLTGHES